MMRPATQTRIHALALNMKGRLAILLMSALVLVSGAAACGVRQGQENVEKAKEVEKQVEKRQQDLEKKLQERDQQLEEGQ